MVCCSNSLKGFPEAIVGYGSLQGKFLPRDGMNEANASGKEGDAAVGIAARRTILEVALDGTADGGELTAYLMVTAREELHLEELIAVTSGQAGEAQLSLLRAGNLVVVSVGLVLLLVTGEPVGEG